MSTQHTRVRHLAAAMTLVMSVLTLYLAGGAGAEEARSDRFAGTWVGSVEQAGSPGYRAKVTIIREGRGYRANVRYPELLCGGVWSLEDRAGDTLRFTEHIRYGGVCADGVAITVTAGSDGSLDYVATFGGESATARLDPAQGRVGPGIPEPGHGLRQWPTDQQEAGAPLMIWFGAAWRVGEWDLGLPTWSSCIEQDLCVAGARDDVGVVQRGAEGYYTVDEFSVDMPARYHLRKLGFSRATVRNLLS